jgi:hypothetical protein
MMETITKVFATAVPLLAVCLLGGCANEETLTERNFGDSVRNMIRVQTYDASTLTNPPAEPVDGTDGQKLEGVLETYRGENAGGTESVGNEIQISVGGGQ